jgi:hypothetical protein
MNSKDLINLINDAGYDARSYSGRGMSRLFADMLDSMVRYNTGDIAALSKLMRNAATDSMGMGIIVYWPSMKWVE